MRTFLTFILLLACGAPLLVQAQPTLGPLAGAWLGRSGPDGLELWLEQEGGFVSGFGALSVPAGSFMFGLSGHFNSSGPTLLAGPAQPGSGFDHVRVLIRPSGAGLRVAVATDDETLGFFELTPEELRPPEGVYRLASDPTLVELDLALGAWTVQSGSLGPFGAESGRLSAWSSGLLEGTVIVTLHDATGDLEIGQFLFSEGPGTRPFEVSFPGNGIARNPGAPFLQGEVQRL